MNTYKVTVEYTVREDVILQAESPEQAEELAQELDADKMEFENRDVVSDVEVFDVEEL